MIHLSANDTETLRHLGRVTIWQPAASHFSVGELADWQAQGGRIKQLPTGKTGQEKGKAK